MRALILSCAILLSCGHNSRSSEFTGSQQKSEQQAFKNVFYTLGKTAYDKNRLSTFLYSPTESFKGIVADNSPRSISKLRYELAAENATHFYDAGLKSSMEEISLAKNSHTTFVIFPGFLTEFSANQPFPEIYEKQASIDAKLFFKLLSQTNDPNLKTANVYNLQNLQNESRFLADLVKVASYDVGEHTRARFILLNPIWGSLETIGDPDVAAKQFIPRISRTLELLKDDSNLAFVGYSRGIRIALSALNEARAQNLPWAKRVETMYSIAGLFHGSILADDAWTGHSSFSEFVNTLRDLQSLEGFNSDEEQVNTSFLKKSLMITRNNARWARAINDFAVAVAHNMNETPTGMRQENTSSSPNFSQYLQIVERFGKETFSLTDPFQYFRNVRKFKILLNALLSGVENLTTENSFTWWKNYTANHPLKIYSIAGVMGPRTNGKPWVLTENRNVFSIGSQDYALMRRGFYDYVAGTNVELNDGQVGFDSAFLWQQLIGNKNINAVPLAVFEAEHWGLLYDETLKSNPVSKTPFPSALLLKTIAEFQNLQ